eukprot:2711725-Karenia_brevis.AAC.1
MAALKLITSGDRPQPVPLTEQWRHTLPLPTLPEAEMAALKLITSGDRPQPVHFFVHFIERWLHTLPLPTLLAS